ncbi:MAG: DNA cytosine methyltransferase, partial [Nitrospira sp.]|nr:DNA cytosine methyltransferase [Nitrospira sp.]
GIDGERSGLWSEYVRAIRALRPRYILVENVPGLLTNEYMGRVLGDLAEIGYDAEWSMFSACSFGASHMRERVFIVAYPNSLGIQAGCQRFRGICTAQSQVWATNQYSSGGEANGESISMWEPEPAISRVANGIPDRVDRIRGLGNAIVPQIAEWLGRQIMKVSR